MADAIFENNKYNKTERIKDTKNWRRNKLLYKKYSEILVIPMDIFENIMNHDCPLTSFEEKYSQNSTTHDFARRVSQLGIFCKCTHIYEKQINALMNIFLMILGKIVIILLVNLYRVILVK